MPEPSLIGAESSYTGINPSDPYNINAIKIGQLRGEHTDLLIAKESKKRERVVKIYATFDDGPQINSSKKVTMTEQILSTLKSNGIKATFFVTHQFGSNAITSAQINAADINNNKRNYSVEVSTGNGKSRDEVIRKIDTGYFKKYLTQIHNDGHTIGIHSYSHSFKYIYKNTDNFLQDFRAIYSLIKYVLKNYETQLYRFPGGSGTCPYSIFESVSDDKKGINIDGKNYCFFDWDIDSDDSKKQTYKDSEGNSKSPADVAKTIENKVINEIVAKVNAGQYDIILLFHDLNDKIGNNLAVENIIKRLKNPSQIKGLSDKQRYQFEFHPLTYKGYTSQKGLRFFRQVYSDTRF